MTVNGIGLIAVIIYTCWRYHSVMNRYYRHDSNASIALEVAYSMLMVWLLASAHISFILAHVAVSIGTAAVGLYYWIRAGPLPNHYGSGLRSYWHHLSLDTAIGIFTWLTMLGGGTVT